MFIKRVPGFEYHAPASLDEALELLARYGRKARVFAGGTDLLGAMKRREIVFDHLINLKGIKALGKVRCTKSRGLEIGALARLGDLERSAVVAEQSAVLRDALNVIASPQIRNLGTIGGNLCSAVPSADTAPPLIASDASVTLAGGSGERSMPVEKFFKGPGRTVLKTGEILTRITIPNPPKNSGGAYIKLMNRNAMELAIVGVAVQLQLSKDGQACRQAAIALGAVAPTPIRARAAEKVVAGRVIDENLAEKAGEAAAAAASPIDNFRASGAYRLEMVRVLTKRALLKACERIREKSNR